MTAIPGRLANEPGTATLPKLSADGESDKMMLPVPLAVPLSGSLCGLPGALSLIVTTPDLVPAEVGVNVTLNGDQAAGANPFKASIAVHGAA